MKVGWPFDMAHERSGPAIEAAVSRHGHPPQRLPRFVRHSGASRQTRTAGGF
jgi:hypothetical protein